MKKIHIAKGDFSTKKKYQKPRLNNLGSVASLTLKTGSISDFGSNQFQP